MAALKVIAKVASMLMDVIMRILKRMFNPVIKPIKNKMEDYVNSLIEVVNQEFSWLLDLGDNHNANRLFLYNISDAYKAVERIWVTR